MLPNVLPSPSPDAHVPVLASEVATLLDVHPGELIVDCTFGAGGHSRLLARGLEGNGQLVAIDRDPTTQPFVDALRATVGTGVQVRPMHGPLRELPAAPARGGRPRRGGADGSRHVLDAGRRAGARLQLHARRAARHAHGPERRADRRDDRQRVGRAAARADLPALRRGALLASDRPGDRPGARARRRSRARCSWSPRSSGPSRRPRASATATPPSTSSRRCGSQSTTSSASSRTASRARSSCASPAAGWP